MSSTGKFFIIPSAQLHGRISFEPPASLTIIVPRNMGEFLTLFLSTLALALALALALGSARLRGRTNYG